MILKIIGIVLIIGSCGGIGFHIAAAHRKEERSLKQLIGILDYMVCELQFRCTPLPSLCRQVAKAFGGLTEKVFTSLARNMDMQVFGDSESCMIKIINRYNDIPPITAQALKDLGKSMGRFDLDGQLKGIEAIKQDCLRSIRMLEDNKESRLRGYQTLGLCAGAAIAILLI